MTCHAKSQAWWTAARLGNCRLLRCTCRMRGIRAAVELDKRNVQKAGMQKFAKVVLYTPCACQSISCNIKPGRMGKIPFCLALNIDIQYIYIYMWLAQIQYINILIWYICTLLPHLAHPWSMRRELPTRLSTVGRPLIWECGRHWGFQGVKMTWMDVEASTN